VGYVDMLIEQGLNIAILMDVTVIHNPDQVDFFLVKVGYLGV
jgi:hypothetical protein